MDVDYRMCVIRKHSFCTDPVGDLISYTFKYRPWADGIVTIAHNAKAFDLHFVLNRLVWVKRLPELLIMNGQNIICSKEENVAWLDSLNYLAMPPRKFPETLVLTADKSWYPHLFNTTANTNYGRQAPYFLYYGIDQMHEYESKGFLSWYETVTKRKYSTTGEC
jgi:hypothetical protein